MNNQQRIKTIEKETIKTAILESPGTLMVGLGLYAKFAANGDAFLPILNDDSVVNGMLFIGAAIMLWGSYKIFTLGREKAQILREINL